MTAQTSRVFARDYIVEPPRPPRLSGVPPTMIAMIAVLLAALLATFPPGHASEAGQDDNVSMFLMGP